MRSIQEQDIAFCGHQEFGDVGEAAYLITKEFREEHQEIAWNEVIGMRHVLVHGYYQIRDEIVWGTIQTDLFPLKDKIERLLCK